MTDLDQRITGVEDALVALGTIEFGDILGHPFHGNQHIAGADAHAYLVAKTRAEDLKSRGDVLPSYLKGADDAVKMYEKGETTGMSSHALAAEAYDAAERAKAPSNGPGPGEDHNYHYGRADVHTTVAVNPTWPSPTGDYRPSPVDRDALAKALATEQEGLLDPGRAWSARVAQAEAAFVAIAQLELGDSPGHPFRGNQYSGGGGVRDDGDDSKASDVARELGISPIDGAMNNTINDGPSAPVANEELWELGVGNGADYLKNGDEFSTPAEVKNYADEQLSVNEKGDYDALDDSTASGQPFDPAKDDPFAPPTETELENHASYMQGLIDYANTAIRLNV